MFKRIIARVIEVLNFVVEYKIDLKILLNKYCTRKNFFLHEPKLYETAIDSVKNFCNMIKFGHYDKIPSQPLHR